MCGFLYIHDPKRQLTGQQMAERVFLALLAEQHRGQHGGGLGYTNGSRVWCNRFFGLVSGQFDALGAHLVPPHPYRDQLKKLVDREPNRVLAHLRYATAGGAADLVHYQPHRIQLVGDTAVFASNGDIPLLEAERAKLARAGVDFESDNDAEFTLRFIAHIRQEEKCSWVDAIRRFMQTIEGAYSGVLMTKKRTFFMRDPLGFRPFVVGRMSDGTIVAASETCSLKILGARFEFEVERGCIVEIEDDGTMHRSSYGGELPVCAAHCTFCLAYFARPDSRVFFDGRSWTEVRQKGSYSYEFGQQLGRIAPVDADFCTSIPASGDKACEGFSRETGLQIIQLFVRNTFVPRTFIMSVQELREFLVRLKLGLMDDVLRKRPRVCIVDDSIVRATTIREVIRIVREAGASEVHIRIPFPPITDPCFMGVAMPTRDELVASNRTLEQIREFIEADSLAYLPPEGLEEAMRRRGDWMSDYCTACFSGKYPLQV